MKVIQNWQRHIFFISLFLFLFSPFYLEAQILDSLTTSTLHNCLEMLHLSEAELGFEKAWVKDDTFKLKVIDNILKNPLELPEYLEKTTEAADEYFNDPGELFIFISQQIDSEIEMETISVPVNAEDPLYFFVNLFNRAESYRKEFYAPLDSLELHDLIMNAPVLWGDETDSLNAKLKGTWQQEFGVYVDTSRTVDKDRMLDIIKKLDRNALTTAGQIILEDVWEIKKQLESDYYGWKQFNYPVPGVKGEILYYLQTDFGPMIVGGMGDNVYSDDFAVIIDLGGNDIYRCRAGGAIGEIGNPYSVVIDLEGDDFYMNQEKAVNQGAGFLGIGILIDLAGNDTYRSSNYSHGAGLFGVGLLYDQAGEDDYRGGYFCQGVGNVGVGMLLDNGYSDDRYLSQIWAQGFGSVFGYGLLRDAGGDDIYRTGGKYLHAPLLPNDYQSFSHGFGMGWRPRAGGGIGVLYDLDGNDFYEGEVFCEGASYWYSLGMLVDGSGNDSYNAAQYAQGAGIHLSIGALWDKDGDDQYNSRNGVVGGTAHDLSVGMLIEEKGNDNYIVSGGYGVALTNSFALFVDKLGNDMYSTWEDFSFGSVRWGRGFAGCGIFMDLEGKDIYPRNTMAADGSLWKQFEWGIGIDLDRDIITGEMEEEIGEIILTAEDSLRSIEELYEEASLWEVGSNRKKVARAKKAFLARRMEAVTYICENKLTSSSSLQIRLIEKLAETYPDSLAPLVLQKIFDENKAIQKNSIRMLGVAKYEKAVKPLLKMLKKKKYHDLRRNIISALGKIGDKTAAKRISQFIDDEDELCRLSVVGALKKLHNPKFLPVLITALDDSMFTVRSAAMTALQDSVDERSIELLMDYIYDISSKYQELGITTLSNMLFSMSDSTKTEYTSFIKDALKLFEEEVSNTSVHIRAAAVEAVYRNGTGQNRAWLDIKMKFESDPLVLAVYKKTKKEILDK
jgi:HEAT repeat protein